MDKESQDQGGGESPRAKNAPAGSILRVDAPKSRIIVQVCATRIYYTLVLFNLWCNSRSICNNSLMTHKFPLKCLGHNLVCMPQEKVRMRGRVIL